MYNKIWNPKTNRYVTLKSRLGQSILREYINQLQGGSDWTKYDKGVKKQGISRIKVAMKKLGLTTSRGGAELEQLKEYIGGIKKYGPLKTGFTKKWDAYLGSKDGVEELANILESRVSNQNLVTEVVQDDTPVENVDVDKDVVGDDDTPALLAIEDGSANQEKEKNVYYCMNPVKAADGAVSDKKARLLSCKSIKKVGNQPGKKKYSNKQECVEQCYTD